MSWDKLTPKQKEKTRKLRGHLGESVSQIAKHFDDACAWDRGEITLDELERRTGWSLTRENDH